MKRLMVMLLLLCALALPFAAQAEEVPLMSEATLIYEDYDGNRAEQTVVANDELLELEGILLRARNNPTELSGNTMNSTLLCIMPDDIYDFAIATDGTACITELSSADSFLMEDQDLVRFWEIFDVVADTMGYNASDIWEW